MRGRLQDVIARATGASTPREVARVIVEEGVAALGGSIGALWLSDGDGTLELLHWTGLEPGRRFRRVPLGGDAPLSLAVRTSKPVWISSRAEYVAAFPQSDHTRQPEGELACACLPLVGTDRAFGGLMFAFRGAHEFPEDERMFLVAIASQCANALERLRLLETLSVLCAAETEARRQAEAASRTKDEFLALLGHELRNPLAPIVTALSLMKLRSASDHERERAVIERQVEHLTRLVDDLLDLSRITRGAIPLVRTPVTLAVAVDRAMEAATSLIQERGHRVHIDVPTWLVLDADPHRLNQVLNNLVVNAAKYTTDGGHIAIAARDDGDLARITVSDDGVGIAEPLIPHVFDMFVQGERDSDRAEGGLGLGLAIVKNVVERHGGRVMVASDGPGRGSTFTVWWPRANARAVVAERRTKVVAPMRPLRVLVVDDNIDAATTLGELLRVLGHEPFVVHDAPSAIAIARDEPLNVALVDLGLPILDGFELIARLRDLPGLESLPAFAVTGYSQESDRARTRAAGFDGHVVKPLGLDDLRSLLAAL